ncbi:MAG: cobalamin-dependent protein [Planctomycetaceae bacterium]|jgi:5-methyltetrahydrofolate--homocysteine methyltransferase|nr:cobalamin-dependent protein [Planctomycetaceae bacterium]
MSTSDKDILKESLASNDEEAVMSAIDRLTGDGVAAEDIVTICNEGMGLLGERFDSGEAFIPDLTFGGMIMKKVMEKLAPRLSSAQSGKQGKTFVIGTVRHDVHDIGKDITVMVLRGNGFNVIDLGVDVSPERFVEAIREHKPEFVGMSLLLTTCYRSIMDTVQAINDANLRNTVKICVGGAAASALVAERCGLDYYAETAIDGVRWAKSF